ncbi:hypothetical protein L914_10668 [Phytophthora nicotianae]|uniref:Uncharacterized protein n=1 Tax=Phytophthora nicotianae TaxID=4792 RepID=W2N650_PHYNI|nr:hypothetical protein L914_10668 [Phytophthora nicotianae]
MLDKVHARQSEKKNIVDCSKSEADWNIWLQSMHDKTVTLLIYDYEVGIGRKQDHQVFIKDCIRPAETDRAGAVAEVSLREIVGRLQDVWGATYDGEAVVWRMWANEATRNLDRSTWDDAVLAQPPPRILRLLRASNSRLQKHLNHLNHSTSIALDCVNASIAEIERLRQDWEAQGRRLEGRKPNLPSPDLSWIFVDVRNRTGFG